MAQHISIRIPRHRRETGLCNYLNLLEKCSSLQQEVQNKSGILDDLAIQKYMDNFVIDFIYNTNAIEVSTLTLSDTALILDGVTINKKPVREILEVQGNYNAFSLINRIIKHDPPITENLIKELHTHVLLDKPAWQGEYTDYE
ncbi:MAG: hypothetical protein FWG02_11770 [Holophagaceae bacterium]|nr:hypothetical protein [Holophagaceae bacterium]